MRIPFTVILQPLTFRPESIGQRSGAIRQVGPCNFLFQSLSFSSAYKFQNFIYNNLLDNWFKILCTIRPESIIRYPRVCVKLPPPQICILNLFSGMRNPKSNLKLYYKRSHIVCVPSPRGQLLVGSVNIWYSKKKKQYSHTCSFRIRSCGTAYYYTLMMRAHVFSFYIVRLRL